MKAAKDFTSIKFYLKNKYKNFLHVKVDFEGGRGNPWLSGDVIKKNKEYISFFRRELKNPSEDIEIKNYERLKVFFESRNKQGVKIYKPTAAYKFIPIPIYDIEFIEKRKFLFYYGSVFISDTLLNSELDFRWLNNYQLYICPSIDEDTNQIRYILMTGRKKPDTKENTKENMKEKIQEFQQLQQEAVVDFNLE